MSEATADQRLAIRRNFEPGTPGARAFTWLRRNLFSSVLNSLLTIVVLALAILILPPLIRWGITQATLHGTTRGDCTGDGACWLFIRARLPLFIYGRYPAGDYWRVDLVGILLVVFCVPVLREQVTHRWVWVALLLTLFPAIAAVLLWGGIFGLGYVDTTLWGGLMLDFIIAFVTVAGSLPLGILLALGRRSQLPVVRTLSIGYIELWRGVPLLTVLFMSRCWYRCSCHRASRLIACCAPWRRSCCSTPPTWRRWCGVGCKA
jgi:general L-amino acid transport system permease protein